MSDSDNITLPRKHIDYAAHALEHFNKDAPDPLVSEIIHHLRTALAAEQPKPEPVAVFDEQMGHPVLLLGSPMLKDKQPLYTAPPDAEALRRDAERYRWVLNWLWRYGLLSREKTRIDTPESFGDWFVLRKPHSIGLSVGYGATEAAAIDAAMKEGKR